MRIGDEVQVSVEFDPADTTEQDVVWFVEDKRIATVSEDGIVTGISVGSTVLRVKQKDVEASVQVEVKPIAVSDIQISADIDGEIQKGESATFSAVVMPANATYPEITWHVSDPALASIDESGMLTALKGGTVTVTASAADGFEAEYMLTIRDSTGVVAAVGLTGLDREDQDASCGAVGIE